MANNRPSTSNEPVETLVFFDLETSSLMPSAPQEFPEPRTYPGNTTQTSADMFRYLTEKVDSNPTGSMPRITEISFVAVRRRIFISGVEDMRKKCSIYYTDSKVKLASYVPTQIFAQQINPELNEEQWKKYEQNKLCRVGFLLKRSFLECQPTFAQSWPLFHAFLGSLPSPVALIAHNGLRFDFRVLLAELRRTNLLHTHPIPSNVVFLDSYIAFGNIEKKYLDDLVVLSENMNWKLITDTALRKRLSDVNSKHSSAKKLKFEDDDNDWANDTAGSDEVIFEGQFAPSTSALKIQQNVVDLTKSPVRNNNQEPLVDGSKSAPPKMVNDKPTLEELSALNPLYFMRTEAWTTAKLRRMKTDFFERKNDNNWIFSHAMTRTHFCKSGNFKLIGLYRDIVGGSFSEHQALDDCNALLQICMAYGDDFLNYLGKHAAKFPSLCAE